MSDIADQLGEQVVEAMERLHVPGVVVGILHNGQEHVVGFGVTNVEHPLPVTPDTLFQIGSITKTFVGTLAMRLVEMGRLDLDAPIRVYLPDLRLSDESAAARVTMRHLLTHTGGWVGDYFNDFGYGDDALAKMAAKVADLPQLTPLGEIWSYNNAGFLLAGRVIEVVAGKSFEAAVKELVFDPLGLTMSFFFPNDVITHRFAVGHDVVNDKPQIARPWAVPRCAAPAGGIVCPAKDLLRYARFHMGDGTAPDGARLLTPESLALMQTPMFSATGLRMMGLSWFVTMAGDIKLIDHGGGTNGQVTDCTVAPSEGYAHAIFSNANRGRELCYEVSQWALKHYLGTAFPEATPLDLSVEQLTPYVGRYEAAMEICDLSLKDGELILQVTEKGGFPTPDSPPPPEQPPPVQVALYAEDRLIALDPPFKDARGEFLRRADGQIVWLRFGWRVHAREK